MGKNKSGGKTSRLDIELNYATRKLKISLNKVKFNKNRTNDSGGMEL